MAIAAGDNVFARSLQANIANYLKGAEDATIQSSVLLSKLKKKGRIKTGGTGNYLDWKLKGGRRSLTPITEGAAFDVERSNNYANLQLNWYGYQMNDAMTEMERLQNGNGPTQIIKMVGGILEDIKSDFETEFNAELYKNGETTTNAGRVHGLETMFQISTATIPTGGAGGQRLAVGAHGTLTYGGRAFSSTKNSHYYMRPTIMIDANSGAYGAGGFSSTNGLKIFDDAVVTQSEQLGNKFPDLGITDFTWYNYLRQALISKESIYIGRPGGKMPEESDDLGFHFVKMNGVPVYPETDWPTMKQGGAHGMYLLYTPAISYDVLGSKFFNDHMEGDIEKGLLTLFAVTHYGQLRTKSPYFQCKIVDKG